jgi:hypothetical protein
MTHNRGRRLVLDEGSMVGVRGGSIAEEALEWSFGGRRRTVKGPGGRGDDGDAHSGIGEARGHRELAGNGEERAVALGAGGEGWGEGKELR